MSFSESLYAIAKKIRELKGGLETEEATKNALVMPFISTVLGYDVFNPNEVIPEFHADVGTKRGEKIDYAVVQDGTIRLLIECKKVGEQLNLRHASQLFRYFSATQARIAILTNGQEYQIYTDGDAPNRMDEKPFLVFDLLDIDDTLIPEMQKLSKETFDLESVINTAEELKYVGMIKRAIAVESREPSGDWLRFFIGRVYGGKATQRVLDQFRPLVVKAMNQYINGQIAERLKNALDDSNVVAPDAESPIKAATVATVPMPLKQTPATAVDSEIITTEEELEGFNIVRAIAVAEVSPERVVYRDAKTYFAVLLDDNNRKPIIRLYLNSKKTKFVTTFENGKGGVRHDIQTVVDIYKVADQIRKVVRGYEDS